MTTKLLYADVGVTELTADRFCTTDGFSSKGLHLKVIYHCSVVTLLQYVSSLNYFHVISAVTSGWET